MEITELTQGILNELIEKIVVHERKNDGKAITQKAEIYCKFIGNALSE